MFFDFPSAMNQRFAPWHGRFAKSRAQGFSLIEIVVTMAVVVIVAAIAIVSYNTFTGKSKVLQIQNFLTDLSARQGQFFQDRRRYADKIEDLKLSVPAEVASNIKAFKLTVQKNDQGRDSFIAIAIPNNQIAGLESVYPLGINESIGYYSLTALCESVRSSTANDVAYDYCKYTDEDKIWAKKPRKPTMGEILAGLAQGTIKPPIALSGVNNVCAYAISVKDRAMFNAQGCAQDYAWPFVSEGAIISDACLEAFNKSDRLAFTQNQCCSSAVWVSKKTGYCTDSGSAQPASVTAYTSPETAGNIQFSGKCVQTTGGSGSALVVTTCTVHDNQKWYLGEDGLWHNKADPSLCIRSGFKTCGYYDWRYTATTCNVNDRNQKGFTYDAKTGQFKNYGDRCTIVSGGPYLCGVGSGSCSGVTSSPSSTDLTTLFATNPACLPAIANKDFNSFASGGCCSIGEWQYDDIRCSSKPINLARSPASATALSFGNGTTCLAPVGVAGAGDAISSSSCNSYYADQRWYTDNNGLLRNAANNNLCIQASSNVQGGTYSLANCDANNALQKFVTVGGQVRLIGTQLCMTPNGYNNNGAVGMVSWSCRSSSANNSGNLSTPSNATVPKASYCGNTVTYDGGRCNGANSWDGGYGSAGNWQLPNYTEGNDYFFFNCGSTWSCKVNKSGTSMTTTRNFRGQIVYKYNKSTGLWDYVGTTP